MSTEVRERNDREEKAQQSKQQADEFVERCLEKEGANRKRAAEENVDGEQKEKEARRSGEPEAPQAATGSGFSNEERKRGREQE